MEPLVVIQNVSLFTIACVVIGWIIRYMFKNFIDKDLEKFKSKLEQETIRFSKLHEDRAYAIKELISKIVDFDSVMHKLTSPFETSDDDREEVFKKAGEVANDFLIFSKKNRIYFNPKICELIDTIDKKGKDAWYAWLLSKDNAHNHQDIDNWKKAWESVDEIPDLIDNLEEQFREILGVDEKNRSI